MKTTFLCEYPDLVIKQTIIFIYGGFGLGF